MIESGPWLASRPEVIPDDAVLELPTPRPHCGEGEGSSSTGIFRGGSWGIARLYERRMEGV